MKYGGQMTALLHELLKKNEWLEYERDTLQTHLDLSAQAIETVTAERDEARAWARRMKRERDEARDLLGMMDIDKIAENLELMRRWLK